MSRYQVVGECAHVVVADHTGVNTLQLLYKGAFLPEGVEPRRLKHLLDTGLVEAEGATPLAPNDPIGSAETGEPVGDGAHPVVTEGQRQSQRDAAESGDDAERKRADARAKLPADGSAPKGSASQEVWAEYAVAQGYDRSEVEKASRDDIRDLFTK